MSASWVVMTPRFYPRPPRGGRHAIKADKYMDDLFLSTPSARRATRQGRRRNNLCNISIHALLAEGDTIPYTNTALVIEISIHALREEGDNGLLYPERRRQDFYPRPPRGGRL